MKLSKLERIIILLILVIGFLFVNPFEKEEYNGPNYLPQPNQTILASPKYVTINNKNETIKVELVASYEITAGVRGRKNYNSDYSAKVSPMDLILAWDDLNQPEILEVVDYKQSGRWYYYNVKPNPRISVNHVGQNSSNTHIIPANKQVLKEIDSIKENNIVIISGYLVNVLFEDGPWSSSLSRTDTGNGACEILLVNEITIN